MTCVKSYIFNIREGSFEALVEPLHRREMDKRLKIDRSASPATGN